MTIVLDSKPTTAEDVGEILGVPKARVKWLKQLMESGARANRVNGKSAVSRQRYKLLNARKKKKAARAKAKKIAR